jgi:hypothetical protein
MLDLILYITSSSSILNSILVLQTIVPWFSLRLIMLMLSGTQLQLLTRLNLKDFKGHLQVYVTPDFLNI